MTQKKETVSAIGTQTQDSSFDPNPVLIHYDRGLQEYSDLFSDEDEPLAENETAETESHRS